MEHDFAAAREEQATPENRQRHRSDEPRGTAALEEELIRQRAQLEQGALEADQLAADAAEKSRKCAELEAQVKTTRELMTAMGSASQKIAEEHSAAARIARQWHRRHTNIMLRDVRKSYATQLEQARRREHELASALRIERNGGNEDSQVRQNIFFGDLSPHLTTCVGRPAESRGHFTEGTALHEAAGRLLPDKCSWLSRTAHWVTVACRQWEQ